MNRIFDFLNKILEADPIDVIVWFFMFLATIGIFGMGLKMFITAIWGN